ncbi:XRE family transcriptional regulator [Aliivibrio wodanis]|uniref:XRE family transcriptional regulator n=1 Tax=Aliivibrio wodanis TaxID=80852 RepID=UPI00406C67A4
MECNDKSSLRALYQGKIDLFKDRLKESIGEESVRSFSLRCGISESVIRKYLNGSYPVMDKMPRIAEAAGKSMEWLVAGSDPQKSSDCLDPNEFALIPGYNIQVSAGHGVVNEENSTPTRYLAFRRKWLKFRGFNESDLAVVWVKGDSMEPTIHNNDTIVVNMNKNTPTDGHLYIFRHGDDLSVKRYQNMLGAWRLISDNQLYSPLDIPKEEQNQFEVIGQVVHISKDI